jgi:hypothetical protein
MTLVEWLSPAGWLSLVLSIAAAVSARWVAREDSRTAGTILGLAAQPGWILLALTTGAWGLLYSTAYWVYTYLRVAGWWPRWLPLPRWPTPLRRLMLARRRHRMPVTAPDTRPGAPLT